MDRIIVWTVAAAAALLVILRPRRIPEAVWAAAGAGALLALRLISPGQALEAVGRGTDVYLFLAGMMMLAELARREGFFDWVAVLAADAARGSRGRLFVLVYAVGTAITVVLSNDATAVVLTPAVLAVLKRARAEPLPYLFACAFIANAASFVLPISNPANLVLYGSHLPPLLRWLASYALPSAASIGATYLILRLLFGRELTGTFAREEGHPSLSAAGRRAAWSIAAAAAVLILASAFGADLGLPTLLAALAGAGWVSRRRRGAALGAVRGISWNVLVLVAGLFVLVSAVDQAGALDLSRKGLAEAAGSGPLSGPLLAAFGVSACANLANNLPIGLLAGGAARAGLVPPALMKALLLGVDLGPNLSVTGSLATILWLVALRREGAEIGFWRFLRVGLVVMPPALALAVLASLLGR